MNHILMQRAGMILLAFLLDLCLGDPLWLWHPVMGIGKVISLTEKCLRKILHLPGEKEEGIVRKRVAGGCLVVITLLISMGILAILLWLTGRVHSYVRFALETIICYQMLAMKSLKTESMKVYRALWAGDVEGARRAVSMIVGRDTEKLTEEGIAKAAVETVAENTSDGEIAPLFYLFLFGVWGIVFYKTVNTMDSMVGYKNDAYRYWGTVAAKLDDVVNFIPARLSAVCMIAAAFLLRFDGRGAARIYSRDRYRHASPNSAQTESVCAGALGVQLAGDASYFGKIVQKPTIGDPVRKVVPEDIRAANRLLYATSFLVLFLGEGVLCLMMFLVSLR